MNCNLCNITCSFLRAGVFSDGKLTFIKQETGGNLSGLIGPEKADLKLIESPIRHLGTEASYEIYSKLEKCLLDNNVNIMFNTMVDDIIEENGKIKSVKTIHYLMVNI